MNLKRGMILGILLLGLFVVPLAGGAPPVALTTTQAHLLKVAREEGKKIKVKGKSMESLMQMVVMQETQAGEFGRGPSGYIVGTKGLGFGQRSYGVAQLRLVAAREVLKEDPSLGRFETDEELITALLSDHEFNIKVAARYLAKLHAETRDVRKTLLAYNKGLTGARNGVDPNKYIRGSLKYKKEVIDPYNKGRFVITSSEVALNR